MKWLLVIALTATTAASPRPPMTPRVVHGCPAATTWPQLTACLKTIGLESVVMGTTEDAKLVQLFVVGDGASLEGFAVYSSNRVGWHLTGFLGQGGRPEDFTVQRFEHLGAAYRFDLATTMDSSTSTNGVISVPAIYRQLMSSFCAGSGWRCTSVVSHCEQIVSGQTVTVYDGTLTVHDRTISIKGSGTKPSCAGDVEEMF